MPSSPEIASPTQVDTSKEVIPKKQHVVGETISSTSIEKRRVVLDSTPKATKTKYRTTPHAKKGTSSSPPKDLNQFSALHAFDEEVESLIANAQQSRKTVHPCLLGVSGRELELGGL